MKKQKKQIIGLLIALVIVVAGYLAVRYLVVDEDLVSVESVSQEVFHIDKETLVELKYTNNQETVELIKDGENWYLKDDKSVSLDQDKVANVLGFASYLNSKTVIDTPASLSDYGLEEPVYTIWLKDASGNEKTYYIGDKYVMADEYFARVEGDNNVYTIADTYPDAFDSGKESLIAKEDTTKEE